MPPRAPSAGDAPISPDTLVARDLDQLRNNLTRTAPATQPSEETRIQQQREESARRLLSRPSPAARDIVLKVMQDRAASPEVKLAIARAIADAADPDPRLAAELLPFLGARPPLHDAVARALCRFGDRPEVRKALIDFAQNAKQPAAMRISVIRAMGKVVDRAVADALYAMLTAQREPAAISSAAGEALTELAALPRDDHDPQRWKRWHDANAAKVDVVWRADVLAARDARAERIAHEQSDYITELQAVLDERYQLSTQAGKDDLVKRLLNSSDPRARVFGLTKVQEALNNAAPLPVEAPARVKELIGDSDPRVRLAAAQAIRQLNDPGALDAVLAQLAQEPDPEVKATLARALVSMNNPRALNALRVLLHDPLINVATSAADALKSLGPKLHDQSELLADDVANELWTVGRQRAAEPGGVDFEAKSLEAIGQLRSRPLATKLLGLLNPNEPEVVRGAALRGLGDLGEQQTAFRISGWLENEPSADNRVDAIDALGHTGTFDEVAPTLYDRLSPAREPSRKVHDRAWLVFQGMLPAAKITSLNDWATKLKDDPTHQKMVLLALNDRLQREFLDNKLPLEERRQREQDLALSRQNTGAVYMKLDDPAEAATLFRQAREYWQKQNVTNQTTAQLVTQLMDALLAAKHYAEAAQFASDEIGADRSQQTLMGPRIRKYVEEAVQSGIQNKDPEKLKDAAKLIAEVAKMKNPLDQRFRDDLADSKKEIDRNLPEGQ
ncbi:MAG: repeat protein [Phycisphaerales bacterium]|nr:repeat protein [Phycisphaerales bacterium]